MSVRILLQARFDSSRLPGKALLPVGGIPSAILAAQRAAAGPHPAVIVTSTEASEDPLVDVCAQYEIPVFRGSKDDVLERFVSATEDMADHDVVVRLTADCMLPDGDFVARLVAAMGEREYLATQSPGDGLPYGLSAEAVRVGLLREAHSKTTPSDTYFREHVTTWVWDQGRAERWDHKLFTEDLSHLRCTLDALDDYLRLHRLFRGVSDPVAISWVELVLRLQDIEPPALKETFIGKVRCTRVALDVTENTPVEVIREAARWGVTIFVAGPSEASFQRLGAAMRTATGNWTYIAVRLQQESQLEMARFFLKPAGVWQALLPGAWDQAGEITFGRDTDLIQPRSISELETSLKPYLRDA